MSFMSNESPNVATPLTKGKRHSKACYVSARWMLTGLGFLGFINVYALRVNLSVAMVAMVNHSAIKDEENNVTGCKVYWNNTHTVPLEDGPFAWEPATQSLIFMAFFIGYIVTQIPGGRLAERLGGKWLFGLGVLITALFSLLTPAASWLGVPAVIFVRILIGFGEGVTYPAMHVLIAKWIPTFERSFKATIIYMGSPIGTVISSIASGFISDDPRIEWPGVFYIFGGIGIAWFFLWAFLIYDTPEDHPRISSEELEYIIRHTEPSEKKKSAPWGQLARSAPLWGLVIAHLGQNCGFYLLLTELPTYLGTILHFDIKQNGFLSALPYLLQAIVGTAAARVMDWIREKNHMSITAIRKMCNSIGFIGPAICLVGVCLAGCNASASVALFCTALAFNGFIYSGYQVVHIDMAPALAGTLFGITNAVATLGGILSPLYAGALTQGHQTLERWNIVFYTASGIYLVSNLVFLVIGSAKLQTWATEEIPDLDSCADPKMNTHTKGDSQLVPIENSSHPEGYQKY